MTFEPKIFEALGHNARRSPSQENDLGNAIEKG
jgi:hypothetical protein